MTYVGSREAPRSFISYWHSQGSAKRRQTPAPWSQPLSSETEKSKAWHHSIYPLEASDCFEELFFEGNRDEPDFIRIFLQFSVGIHHAQMGQWRPAVERIEEGLLLVSANQDDRGLGLTALAEGMRDGVGSLRDKRKPLWPTIIWLSTLQDSHEWRVGKSAVKSLPC